MEKKGKKKKPNHKQIAPPHQDGEEVHLVQNVVSHSSEGKHNIFSPHLHFLIPATHGSVNRCTDMLICNKPLYVIMK